MLTINFNPFPILETNRLILRRPVATDVHEMFAMRSNPVLMRYVPRPLCKNLEDAAAHLSLINSKIDENLGINWAVTLRGNDKMIGLMGIYQLRPEDYRGEIGYMVLGEYSGQGITSEAVRAIVQYGFDGLKLNSVEAIIDPANIASQMVLEKNGFRREAHLRENVFYEGQFLDSVIYSRLASDH